MLATNSAMSLVFVVFSWKRLDQVVKESGRVSPAGRLETHTETSVIEVSTYHPEHAGDNELPYTNHASGCSLGGRGVPAKRFSRAGEKNGGGRKFH